ncbi:TldD/PmbA family protein [Elusimicrobiota bacterium]
MLIKKLHFNKILAFFLLLVFVPCVKAQEKDPLVSAARVMSDEIKYSIANIKDKESPPLYFLLYRLALRETYSLRCSYGDIGFEEYSSEQIPFVEARVGTYEFDNTRNGFASKADWGTASLEFSSTTIRHIFWYLTDIAYKRAVKKYWDKKAELVGHPEEEELPDFSKEEPQQAVLGLDKMPKLDKDLLMRLCRTSSREFLKYPEIDFGLTSVSFRSEAWVMVNSEGAMIIEDARHTPYSFRIYAEAQADDGLEVSSYRQKHSRDPSGLPDPEEIKKFMAVVAEEVKDLKNAPQGTPSVAPVLVDGEATGVLFHEALGHHLEGRRQREKFELQTFKGKLGEKILPDFISLASNPLIKKYKNAEIAGHYTHDSEGVPAREISLVKNGILENYLVSRRPISGFMRSNGSARSDAASLSEGRMSVIIIDSNAPLKDADLKNRFLEVLKEKKHKFGFRIVGMDSGETYTSRGQSQSFVGRPRLVYMVKANGRETLVRGMEFVGTPLMAVKGIIAAGKNMSVKNAFCGAGSGWVPVTHIAPPVIISSLELQKQPEDRFKPPLIKAPIFR